ncbi:MAG TPA: response regulator [Woeseiaceae bacterium]|nr:response regulator [Woeseiaceae bacterium]
MPEKANILLVDDQPERLLTYEVILESLDQNLVRALSGEEAFEKLHEREFAAILLDVSMPGMNGFETAALVRNHPRFGQTPIIFVTGVHITDLDRLRGYEMGAADYVYVPVIPDVLRGKVQVLVQLYLQRRELAQLNERLAMANDELAEAHARLQAENTRELQKLNRTLERANAQLISEVADRKHAEALLKEEARRKDEFISILGHELRNPLAAMQSGIELLRNASPAESKLPWARELLQRQLRHLKRLIDDLLDVSRITSGRVQLQRETIDLKSVIEHSMDAAQPLVAERKHEVNVDLPQEPLYMDGDPVRLTQVFGNLLTNAAKYTEPGGTITLSAAIEPGPPRSVTIRVRDTGAGIPEDMLDRVFELFTQADHDATRTQTGLGIGLALVRALADLHGGSVHATSAGPDQGAEFVVRLPLLEDGAKRKAQPAVAAPSAPQCGLRLLIIDDNEDLAKGLSLYLTERSGHEVRTANNGEDGIEIAREFKPHVVLLDIGLPDIDGYEVARRLRAEDDFEDVPLIGISGFSTAADRKRAKRAGFDRYFVKPIAFDKLNDVLAGQLAPAAGRVAG